MQTLEQANEFVQYLLKVSGKDKIEGLLLDCVKVTKIDTNSGEIELEVAKTKQMKVESRHLNAYGNLHGGMLGLLIDWAGSIAISAKLRSIMSGVSTDMAVSCIRTATLGDVLKYCLAD
jgi:uncharacterized protein (TIGR00369 family)